MPELVCVASDRPAWLAARRQGVTATDIVTILGLSSWDSPYSLYWRKLGEIPEVPDSDRFRLGRYLEEYVAARWAMENAYGLGNMIPGELWRSAARPWQLATLDRRLVSDAGPGGVLEVKTWADADRHAWDDGPPASVRAQVLWQMDVMDVAAGHVGVVFLPSGEFASHMIGHDTQAEHEANWADIKLMRQAGEEFMARLRGELPPPDPDQSMATLAAVRARFPKREGKRGQVDMTTWAAWADARDVLKAWEGRARELETRLREELGECDEIEVDGQLAGRRVVVDAKVKAHTRHQDYIMRISPRGEQGDG